MINIVYIMFDINLKIIMFTHLYVLKLLKKSELMLDIHTQKVL